MGLAVIRHQLAALTVTAFIGAALFSLCAEMGSVEHLKQHQYKMPAGQVPLSKKPLAIRLYQSDDDAIRAMGKAGKKFVRDEVSGELLRHVAAHVKG